MFGQTASERSALEGLYEDICRIWHPEGVADQRGIAHIQWQAGADGVICGLSADKERSGWSKAPLYLQNRSGLRSTAHQELDFDRLLFLPPEVDIRAGDRVEVFRFGRMETEPKSMEFDVIGAPLHYTTHQQVCLRRIAVA